MAPGFKHLFSMKKRCDGCNNNRFMASEETCRQMAHGNWLPAAVLGLIEL